jgi:hypothetical protein
LSPMSCASPSTSTASCFSGAVEVEDIGSGRMLAAELQSGRSRAEILPEAQLRRRHVAAQLAGSRDRPPKLLHRRRSVPLHRISCGPPPHLSMGRTSHFCDEITVDK